RLAMPGTGFFEIPEKKWGWYLFAGVDARAVARNIFLDGNTFKDSPSVDKFPLVADANAGLALTYDQLRISYTLV
ncbi:lipid A-modifier LpxR family protein, partial [Staphylococcus aureus]